MVVLPLHTLIVFTIATLMNPKFLLQMRCLVCKSNKTEAAMARKFNNKINQQLEEAVQYCMGNNVREYKALQTAFFH